MKLVFIGGRDIHILGGIENYMLNLTRELTKLGHECIVWCESDHHEEKNVNGVRVIYHPGPKSNFICKPWCGLKATLKTLLHEKNVSFIHYNAWPASLWSWIPRLCGVPSAMEGHGLEWQRSKYVPWAKVILKVMERITAHTNQHLIMCSEAQVRFFKTHYRVESVCIPGAVNLPDLERENASDILSRFGLEQGKYFLFMGRLVQDKNPDYLIRAYMNSGIKDYKLVIAGSNPQVPSYEMKLRELAKDCPSVVFTGAVYDEDKDQLLRNAYCFCLPSTIEGLSIVMMEAASYKLPVIASAIEANSEFLGRDAIYVAPESEEDLVEALQCAMNKPEELQSMVDANYQKLIKKYTWDKVALKYLDYLHSIGVK